MFLRLKRPRQEGTWAGGTPSSRPAREIERTGLSLLVERLKKIADAQPESDGAA